VAAAAAAAVLTTVTQVLAVLEERVPSMVAVAEVHTSLVTGVTVLKAA
jgi:hypothetical protein